jgi:hypothetical protein
MYHGLAGYILKYLLIINVCDWESKNVLVTMIYFKIGQIVNSDHARPQIWTHQIYTDLYSTLSLIGPDDPHGILAAQSRKRKEVF